MEKMELRKNNQEIKKKLFTALRKDDSSGCKVHQMTCGNLEGYQHRQVLVRFMKNN